MSVPVFAKPPCIVRLHSREDYFAFLREHHIPYEEWKEENRLKAWKEIREGDAVYVTDDLYGAARIPVRWIIPIVVRIVIDHPDLGRLALTEFVRYGDIYKPRSRGAKGSSLSEKALLDPSTGELLETPAETIIRCIWQEMGVAVPRREISEKNLIFQPVPAQRSSLNFVSRNFGKGAENVELDDGPTNKYPHLLTFRQVVRFNLTLPAHHYRAEGHQDAATKYFSFWRSVHERGSMEPLPVNQVLRMRKASA